MVFFPEGADGGVLRDDGSREYAFDTGGGGALDRHYLNRATTGYFQELIRVRISYVFCISMNLIDVVILITFTAGPLQADKTVTL
jgi:hypothetical protein